MTPVPQEGDGVSGTVEYQGVDRNGFHLLPRSSCCNAPVVFYRHEARRFVVLQPEQECPIDSRCGGCNRPLSGPAA